jgi:hypothetical protein
VDGGGHVQASHVCGASPRPWRWVGERRGLEDACGTGAYAVAILPQTAYRFLAPLRLAARLAFIGLGGVFGFGFVAFGFAGSFGSAIPLLLQG